MTNKIAIGINHPAGSLRTEESVNILRSYAIGPKIYPWNMATHGPKQGLGRDWAQILKESLPLHPVSRWGKPGYDLFIEHGNENRERKDDATNHVVPCNGLLALNRQRGFKNAQSHSLLAQNLQFDRVFQSNTLSLNSSASSLGVGLGVLEIRDTLSGCLINVFDELLGGGYSVWGDSL
jgi:hypothetical protein